MGVVLERGEVLPRNESEHGRSRYFGLANLNAGVQQHVASEVNA